MSMNVTRAILLLALIGLFSACTREPEPPVDTLLQHVPADTPYVFVTSKPLPTPLRDKLGDHYAAQLAAQGPALQRVRDRLTASPEGEKFLTTSGRLFDVVEALFAEFEHRDTAAAMRELGVEPVTRSAFYGIGLLPAVRIEIADEAKLNALLDRVEKRAGVTADKGVSQGLAYRRMDLGPVDAVIAVRDGFLIAGLLADQLFERDLGLLLGHSLPEHKLSDTGDVAKLIARHGFTGYGEGFFRLDTFVAALLGKGEGRNAEVMQALAETPLPTSEACLQMTEHLVAGMPRMVMGITRADDTQLVARGIWESTPAVAGYLQKMAAPVPGVGADFEGLMSFGLGLDLPQLRNAIDALLREVMDAGAACEWVDREQLQAVIPQLNLALGPMTAGIKGFNFQLDDLELDPETLAPSRVRAGLLAAVDDPRGIFALGAMFNPALAALQVPDDGSLVDLPIDFGLDQAIPPLKVAIRDKALLLFAGADTADLASPLLSAVAISPPPLFSVDYGVYQMVERFGAMLDRAEAKLIEQGENDLAGELREQLEGFRLQARLFERLRVSVHASAEGLVMDQVMQLR